MALRWSNGVSFSDSRCSPHGAGNAVTWNLTVKFASAVLNADGLFTSWKPLGGYDHRPSAPPLWVLNFRGFWGEIEWLPVLYTLGLFFMILNH